MGIGVDIKSVLQELGTDVIIHKLTGGTVTGEKVDTEVFTETSSEWRRQHFVSVTFQYDTQVSTSDVIEINGEFYVVTSKDPSLFENEPVDYLCACFRCNCYGMFYRFTENPGFDTNYEPLPQFVLQRDLVRAMFVEDLRNSEYKTIAGVSAEEIIAGHLYISPYTDTLVGDRWYPDRTDLTEYYMVKLIQRYRLSGTHVISLVEDKR